MKTPLEEYFYAEVARHIFLRRQDTEDVDWSKTYWDRFRAEAKYYTPPYRVQRRMDGLFRKLTAVKTNGAACRRHL